MNTTLSMRGAVVLFLGVVVIALAMAGSAFVRAEEESTTKRVAVGAYEIEIVSINPIEGGVEVFARAWDENGQIGFGTDGSVDIERFRIFNPPTMVHETDGSLRDDSTEALLRSVVSTLSVMKNKHDPQNIVPGKIGNTTSTFFADPDGDGVVGRINQLTWSDARDIATGTDIATNLENDYIGGGKEAASTYHVRRSFFPFDTSSIGDSDTITSATLSIHRTSEAPIGTTSTTFGVVQTSQASPAGLNANDFDEMTINSPQEGTDSRIDYSATSTYINAGLNATGLGWISKTGYTLLGVRHSDDIDNTNPTVVNQAGIYYADRSGTSEDPKLIVEHSAPPNPALKVRKASNESVSNTVALQNDNELVLNLESNTEYIIDGLVYASAGNGTPDLRLAFSAPSGATVSIAYHNTTLQEVLAGAATSSNIQLTTTMIPINFSGTIVMGANAGDLTFKWAQNTSNVNPTTIHAGSFFRADEI